MTVSQPLDPTHRDPTTAPGDDFYQYANGGWLAANPVPAEYGAWGDKFMYGKRRTGVIRSTVWVGPDGNVIKHWRKVPKSGDHPGHVLDAIESSSGE